MVEWFGLEGGGFPGVAAVTGLAVGSKKTGVDLGFAVTGDAGRTGLIVAVIGMAGIAFNLAVFP